MRLLLLLLLLPLAVHAGCTFGTTHLLRERTANSPPFLNGVSLTIETRASGLFGLGTYQRYLLVTRAGAPVAESWLGDNLAAVWAINVYQTGSHELVLAHRLSAFKVDAATGSVRPEPQWECGKGRPPGATYLGVFDGVEGRKVPFRFIPAVEREERPIFQALEMC